MQLDTNVCTPFIQFLNQLFALINSQWLNFQFCTFLKNEMNIVWNNQCFSINIKLLILLDTSHRKFSAFRWKLRHSTWVNVVYPEYLLWLDPQCTWTISPPTMCCVVATIIRITYTSDNFKVCLTYTQ